MLGHTFENFKVFRSPVSPTTPLSGVERNLFTEHGETIALFGYGYDLHDGPGDSFWQLLFIGTLTDLEGIFMPLMTELCQQGDVHLLRANMQSVRDMIKASYESCCSMTVDSLLGLGVGAYSWSAQEFMQINERLQHGENPVSFEDMDGERQGYVLMAQDGVDIFVAQASTLTQQIRGHIQHVFPRMHPLRGYMARQKTA